MDLQYAQTRIYRWAKNSPALEDQVACDTVFAALRERESLLAEVAQWRSEHALNEAGTNVAPDPPASWRRAPNSQRSVEGSPTGPQRPDRTED